MSGFMVQSNHISAPNTERSIVKNPSLVENLRRSSENPQNTRMADTSRTAKEKSLGTIEGGGENSEYKKNDKIRPKKELFNYLSKEGIKDR